jgi:hypothetical protein
MQIILLNKSTWDAICLTSSEIENVITVDCPEMNAETYECCGGGEENPFVL